MLKEKYSDKIEYEADLIESILNIVEENDGANILSSIILTGSFGRNEPTYQTGEDGYLILKSDVEIACIYKKDKERAERLIKKISGEFNEDLNLMPISERRVRNAFNFNGTVVVPKYKTIFTYDLFNGSRTIWGQDFIGTKRIGIESCDPYEAKRLVANRIGELCYLCEANSTSKEYTRKQWKGKLLLAIGSGWLICERQYASSYHEQFAVIEKNKETICSILGETFFEDYKSTFLFLRESGSSFEVSNERLQEYVKLIDGYFQLKGIKQPRVNSVSRIAKYFLKYLKTSREFGFIHFEDGILQTLITQYADAGTAIKETAKTWHEVLY